jgi:hypothetical protein
MNKPASQKGFKLSELNKRQAEPFAGITPTKVIVLKPGVFINPTEAIRLIRAGK